MKVLSDITELGGKKVLHVSDIMKTCCTANITALVAFYGVMHVFYKELYSKTLSMRIAALLIILLTACKLSTTNEYVGSWYQCDYLGQYSEIHISSKELIHNWNFPNGWYSPYTYEVINDTLVYYDTLHNLHDENGNARILKMQGVLDHERLILHWGTRYSTNYIWTFQKMPFEPEKYKKNDSISYDTWLNQKFYKRSQFFNCQDQRTEEERKQDSIEMEQFLNSSDIL